MNSIVQELKDGFVPLTQADKQPLFDDMKQYSKEHDCTQLVTDEELLDDIQFRIDHDNNWVGLQACFICNFKSKWEN